MAPKHAAVLIAFTVLLVLGAVFVGWGFLSPTITWTGFLTFNSVGLLLWFVALIVVFSAFGTPKGKGK